MDDPYITLENDFIETEWWILDKVFKEGLIYEGHKILPYCPRCGTGLASHEVAQGYEEIKTMTAYAKFKKKDEDAYFLAWTTTPWTLLSNVSLTVHPDVDYVKIRTKDKEDVKGETYILAKPLADKVISEEYEVLEEMKGKDLEYVEYEQLLPYVEAPAGKKAFFVTLADYVTVEDGTGVVHTAPAFGEDDYNTGMKYDLPVLNPVDDTGRFRGTPWSEMFVMDADQPILKWLKENGKLYKKELVLHNYPHCWRCHTPLLYYARPSWYIQMTKSGEIEYFKSNAKYEDIPIVILINEGSASASEIMAGAMKDNKRAVLVGNRTFGKGIVQKVQRFGNEGEGIKMTVSEYFTPAGINIHGVGIEPDVEIELPDDAEGYGYEYYETDTQLQKAVEILRK
jgi:isoleucyl-tRNA synthetase